MFSQLYVLSVVYSLRLGPSPLSLQVIVHSFILLSISSCGSSSSVSGIVYLNNSHDISSYHSHS